METVVLIGRVVLAVVFATAGLAKIGDLPGTRATIAAFGVPQSVANVSGTLLPFAELVTAIALVPAPTAVAGAIAALVLLGVFMGGIVNALTHGRSPECNCFGQLVSSRVSWRTLARNAVLFTVAAFVAAEGPGASISGWTSNGTASDLVAGLGVLAAIILAVVAFRYWRMNGALRQQLYRTSNELARLPRGLPVGMPAPEFELPDLRGDVVTLESLRGPGLPVALVFTSPGCGPCIGLLPEIARWSTALESRLRFAIVSNGSENREQLASMLGDVGAAATLIQDAEEVADTYRVRSTPLAVVVAPDGRIASAQAGGTDQIEELVRVWVRRDGGAAIHSDWTAATV